MKPISLASLLSISLIAGFSSGCATPQKIESTSQADAKIEALSYCSSPRRDVAQRLRSAGYVVDEDKWETNFLPIEYETVRFILGSLEQERFRQYRLSKEGEGTRITLRYKIVDHPHPMDQGETPVTRFEDTALISENLEIIKRARIEACGIGELTDKGSASPDGKTLYEEMSEFISTQCRKGYNDACEFLIRRLCD